MKYSALALVLTATFTTSVFAHGLKPDQKEAVKTFCDAESKYSHHYPFKIFCEDFKKDGDAYDAADVAGGVSHHFNNYVASRGAASTLIEALGMQDRYKLTPCN